MAINSLADTTCLILGEYEQWRQTDTPMPVMHLTLANVLVMITKVSELTTGALSNLPKSDSTPEGVLTAYNDLLLHLDTAEQVITKELVTCPILGELAILKLMVKSEALYLVLKSK